MFDISADWPIGTNVPANLRFFNYPHCSSVEQFVNPVPFQCINHKHYSVNTHKIRNHRKMYFKVLSINFMSKEQLPYILECSPPPPPFQFFPQICMCYVHICMQVLYSCVIILLYHSCLFTSFSNINRFV